MKFSKDYVGKKVKIRTRYGKLIDGLVTDVRHGVVHLQLEIGSASLLEGQIVAVEEESKDAQD